MFVADNIARYLRKPQALVLLVRPGNLLMVFAGVCVGAVIEAGFADRLLNNMFSSVVLAGVSAVLVAGGGNALNDYFDVEVDRINRPDRVLPSGLLNPVAVVIISAVMMVVGILFGFVVSSFHGLIALACAVTLVLYNRYLKVQGLIGNIIVSLMVGVTLLYGGLVVGSGSIALVGASFAFLLTVAREIVKDMEDVDGDLTVDSKSLPLTHGSSAAGNVATAVIAMTILSTPVPFILGSFGGLFLLCMVVVNIILLRSVSYIRSGGDERKTSTLLKVSMLCGMIGLIVGRIGE